MRLLRGSLVKRCTGEAIGLDLLRGILQTGVTLMKEDRPAKPLEEGIDPSNEKVVLEKIKEPKTEETPVRDEEPDRELGSKGSSNRD